MAARPGTVGYSVVFLIGVGIWCAGGWFLAGREPVAEVLSRWGHVLLPWLWSCWAW